MKKYLAITLLIVLAGVLILSSCAAPAPTTKPTPTPTPAPSASWKPSDTIHWICPQGPGGGFDQWSRALAKTYQKYVGVTVVVDNVDGTGGANGTMQLYRSKPDGQTVMLLQLNEMMPVQKILKPGFDVLEMTLLGIPRITPFALFANAKSPFNTVPEIVKAAKVSPLRGGTSGLASGLWQSMAVFANEAGIDIQPVAGYKSGAEILVGLEAGDCDLMFIPLQVASATLKRGAIKVVATAGAKRDPNIPDIPTFAEAGYPKTSTFAGNMMCVAAPPKTPPEIASFLEKALADTCKDPEYTDWVKTQKESHVLLNSKESRELAIKTDQIIVEFLPILSKYIK